ncbi:sensor histidine kinase [Pseudoduganella violacea]|uniref:histidine kinase n=1 Tax=Pseudoduganella violacea TaxID=1715466 RepID=A0A7W5B5W6_9BURK|nr:HAMP domain-containing sensor histidine kinase [Pseudoduganella violacea]MBB3117177.1 signal transduction histidine kinase [Pseudoduganella violacea]
MASERGPKLALVAGALVLMAVSAAATSVLYAQPDSPRLLALCGIGAAAAAALMWHGLSKLEVRQPRREAPASAFLPAGRATSTTDGDDGMANWQGLHPAALALEARLEHAPIALFRIAHLSGAGEATPLNANARRLLAPGRASAPQQLCEVLAAQPADQRNLISFDTERGLERAMLAVSALTVQGEGQRIAALLPVESELEAEALNAWRQLVHILTHEIMNSLTPVASLSRTARELLEEMQAPQPAQAAELADDLRTSLDAIARRAASLADFVGSYRSLSTVPEAQPERVRLGDLFARLAALLAADWQARGGNAEFSVEPASLEVLVDPGQLEQALINLLKNAAEATAAQARPTATVSARLSRGGRLRIEVADNGPGVPDELAAHIFTPFFSTKKQGRGIGLAMVRHLVHGNGGTVRYARTVSSGARFIVTF